MKKLLMTIGAAAMLPFATFAAWSEAYTTTTNGVTWTYKVDAENNQLMLGTSTTVTGWETTIPISTKGKLCVPTSIVHEGVSYNDTTFGYGAFRGCDSLTGIVIPKTTFSQTGCTTMFRVVTNCRAIWWQGPETVTDGEQPTANITDLTAFVRQSSGTNPKVVVFGPNVTHSGSVSDMFQGCNGTVAFLPKAHWSAGSYSGTNCKQIFYGPGEDIDISIDGTFTVATSNRLDEVLSVANYLHDYCDMNPKINVTNVIEVADGIITAGKLAFLDNRTFNSLVFKVNTQAQLDTLLAAIPSSVPFAINPADSKVELTVPQGREVYVKLSAEGRNGKYRPKINGLMITFF